jgi:hypothetical protein
MIPLKMPNLPTGPVRAVILSGENITLAEAFKSQNIEVLFTQNNQNIDAEVSFHADMLCHHIFDCDIILSTEQMFLAGALKSIGFNPIMLRTPLYSPYPYDVALNAARIDKFLICNPKTVSEQILNTSEENKLEIICVSQGYTKCSVCIINSRAIITEDEGIQKACEKKGIEVLHISKGSVKLRNHAYGFLGGCTGLIDKNKLAVTGNLSKHSDYKQINEFLMKHEIEAISVLDDELTDIGGIIPIAQ